MPLRRAVVLALTPLLALAAAPPVSARITASQITAPADQHEAFAVPDAQMVIRGTVTGDPGPDGVDLTCFGPDDERVDVLQPSIDVDGAGRFAEQVDVDDFDARPCVLRAVPAGVALSPVPFADVPSPFAGPEIRVSDSSVDTVGGTGPNAGTPALQVVRYDLADAIGGVTSLGSCGVDRVELLDRPSLRRRPGPWYCNAAILAWDGQGREEDSARSMLQVDGEDAYLSAFLLFDPFRNGLDEIPGLPGVDFTAGREADGSIRATENHVVLRCAAPAHPPSPATCPSAPGAGLELRRETRVTARGSEVTVTDELRSTDGREHDVDLVMAQAMNDAVAVKAPGETAFAPLVAGRTIPLGGPAPQTIFTRSADAGDDRADGVAKGAITFEPAPESLHALDPGWFRAQYRLRVPAGGTTSLTQVFSTAPTQAAAEQLAEATRTRLADQLPPPPGPPAPAATRTTPAPAATPATPTPQGPGAAPRAMPLDRTAPRLTRASLSRVRLRRGTRARITWTLSERATTRLTFERAVTRGRRTRYVAAGSLTHPPSRAGTQRLTFTGKVGRRALASGRYRLTLTAVDAAGNRSRPRRLAFTMLRSR